jgi:PAS domain S-box-containing protein
MSEHKTKAPLNLNEAERLEALKRYYILDTKEDEAFDKLTRLAALICGTPISLVSLLDAERQWFKSRVGMPLKQTPKEISFCQHAIQQETLFEVTDATIDDRFKHSPLVTDDPNIRFYAGYQLIDQQGYALGTLCVMDTKLRVLTKEQKEALQLLGESAIELIEQQRKNQELAEFEKIFQQSEDFICIVNAEGLLTRWNETFKKLGYWQEKVGQTLSLELLIHPDDLPMVNAAIKRAKQKTTKGIFTARCKTKAGEMLIIEWGATVEEATGNVFAIGRDITLEREKEQILTASENRFRSFFENSQGLMCTHDAEGQFLSVNTAGAGLLGFTVAEVLAKTLYDLVQPQFHRALKVYLQQIVRTRKASGVLKFTHKDGSLRTWMFNNILEEGADGNNYIIGNAIDITERDILEKDLNHTKEVLEEMSKVARIGGWEFDVVKHTLFWSDITKEIHEVPLTFSPEVSTAILFYKEGNSRKRIMELIERAIETGRGWDEELELISAQGREIWVRAIGSAYFEGDKCIRLFGTFQDIDEKKRAQLEISASRKELQDLMQAASMVGIISTDPNGIIKVFNKGAENMLGYTAEEMVDKQSPAVLHDANEVILRGIELSEMYHKKIEGFSVFVHESELNRVEEREWTYIQKDGGRLTVSLVVSCIRGNDNEITGYLGVATDITSRKEAKTALLNEKLRLQAFVEHAPAAVAMLDNDLRYVAVSNRWVEEYKLDGKQLIGHSHYDIFPNVSQVWKEIHQRCLLGAVEKSNEDIWRPEGWEHDQYLKWEIRPWYLFDGTVGGIMMFTQDITEVSLQRLELKLAKRNAEEANIAKSEFLANMSHEIRTPLNGVIGFTDLLLKTEINETQKQYLSIVNQSGNALLGIINDILDFSKIEAGKLELDIERADLYDIGSQAADVISFQAQQKGLEILLNISNELPRFIWADEIRLKQVLINLLGNASKFTEKGEIELKIYPLMVPETPSENYTIRFEVRDTGIGIKPERQQKIFEAFGQEDASTTKKYGGTGLGLTISNKLLLLMGSRLQLSSMLRKGSVFFFDLSLKAEQGEQVNWDGLEQIKEVLIVDDNDNNRLILRQMLLLKQISSDEARNGIEALTLLAARKKKYDVIFMDYHMPIMDGLETIKKIRSSFFDTAEEQPIILLYSSSSDETVLRACEDLKVNQRIVKPIKMQEMYDALSKLTRSGGYSNPTTVIELEEQSYKGGGTVLLVEDNHFNMLLAATIIRRIIPNVNLVEMENGVDAIGYCQTQTPDIIFMDVQMPNMNGYETTKHIRTIAACKNVPVIALTAGNLKGEKERCLEAGMNDFLTKPIVEEMLVGMLDKWLLSDSAKPKDEKGKKTEDSDRHLNLQSLRDLSGDDETFLTSILSVAKRDIVNLLTGIETAAGRMDFEDMKMKAHTLKGVTLSIGAMQLAGYANEIESLEQFNESDIKRLSELVRAEVYLVLPLLEANITTA